MSSDQSIFIPANLRGDQDGNGLIIENELNAVYSLYATNSPWLLMTNVAGLGGTTVAFDLSNGLAQAYGVQYSTDLVNWINLGLANPRYLFTDTNAPASPHRYYRLRWP